MITSFTRWQQLILKHAAGHWIQYYDSKHRNQDSKWQSGLGSRYSGVIIFVALIFLSDWEYILGVMREMDVDAICGLARDGKHSEVATALLRDSLLAQKADQVRISINFYRAILQCKWIWTDSNLCDAWHDAIETGRPCCILHFDLDYEWFILRQFI